MDKEKIGARCNEIGHDALPLRRLAGQGIVAGQTAGLEVARSGSAMPALGQKQTWEQVRSMSALPPKADSCSAAKSIERSDDFIDQRLHVEVIGWRNADTPTGFFDRTGNDGPNGGYFGPQQTLSQRLFGLICLCH